jgi:hypothetical protein
VIVALAVVLAGPLRFGVIMFVVAAVSVAVGG